VQYLNYKLELMEQLTAKEISNKERELQKQIKASWEAVYKNFIEITDALYEKHKKETSDTYEMGFMDNSDHFISIRSLGLHFVKFEDLKRK
jgi:hypothetical protein